MKTKVTLLAILALLASLLLVVACGGDGEGDDDAAIRTQKGLGVAALATGAGLGGAGGGAGGIGGGARPGAGGCAPPRGGGAAPGQPEGEPIGEGQQISEADLQPVVDAIVAQGVSSADIEVITEPLYGDPYYGGTATIRVTVGS